MAQRQLCGATRLMTVRQRGVAAALLVAGLLACTGEPVNIVGPTGPSSRISGLVPGAATLSAAPPVVTQISSTDWGTEAIGSLPSGWSQVWDPTNYFLIAAEPSVASGKVLQWSATGQQRNRWGLAYNGFGDVKDQEVYTELRAHVAPVSDVSYMGAAAVRMSGTGADEHGYAVFLVNNPSWNVRNVVLATWVNGGYYYELGSYALSWTDDTWYSVRLHAIGQQISARIWPRGTTEPTTWQLDAWDPNYASGRPGVVNHDNGSVQWARWTGSVLTDTSTTTTTPTGTSYQSTFSEFPTGSQPNGWTETAYPANSAWSVVADATVSDARVLRDVITVTGRHILRYDAIRDTTTTQEVLVKMRLGDDDDRGPGVALRHTMDANGRETAYVAYLRSASDQVEVNAFVAGGWQYVGGANFVNNPGIWYWMRFRAEGTTLRVRVWADAAAEPTTWTFSGSNSAIAAGSVGLYGYEPNVVDYDAFSVATGGLTAPSPTPSPPPPPPTLTQVNVTPATTSLQVGATQQFQATGIMSDGTTTSPTVNWSATGGTISSSGLFTAGSAPGTYSVTATEPSSGRVGTASVTITAPPPPPTLTQVNVTPATTSLQVGATQQFQATGTMSNGTTTSPTVNWSATGGTINSTGLFTAGTTPGTYQVSATEPNSGRVGTASVTISAAPPPPPPPPAGTTWQTGFANYATGAIPTGWTATSRPNNTTWAVAADATAADGFVLRNVTTVTERHIIRWDAIPDTATTQEVLVRMRLGNDDDRGPGIALRHTMTNGSETAYVAYLRSSSDQVEINAFVAGGWQFVGAASFVNNPGQWYWMRFRAEGTSLKVRVWADGAAEPSTRTFSGTNASIASGSAGLYVYEPNTVDFDLISVATGGAIAP